MATAVQIAVYMACRGAGQIREEVIIEEGGEENDGEENEKGVAGKWTRPSVSSARRKRSSPCYHVSTRRCRGERLMTEVGKMAQRLRGSDATDSDDVVAEAVPPTS